MTDTNELFTFYEAGRAAGRLTTYDTEAKVVAGTIILAIQRDRCYVCDPEGTDLFEAEVEEQYGLGCHDTNHAAYSAGFTAGAMETVFQEAIRREICGRR
jgi:hypothetical protein